MALLGNRLTGFRFHRAAITMSETKGSFRTEVRSVDGAEAHVKIRPAGDAPLATGSLFDSPQQRDALLFYRPLGLGVDRRGRLRLTRVVRDRKAWREEPVEVVRASWGWLRRTEQSDLRLERAVRLAPVDYRWVPGETIERAGGV